MLSSLLTLFRQRYPQGSLTSDLLTLHDGQYVVRVCAGAGGHTLACGLGANAALDLAEDQATTRALERLGLTATSASVVPLAFKTEMPPVVGVPQPPALSLVAEPLAASPTSANATGSSPADPVRQRPEPVADLGPELELPELELPELELQPGAMAIPPVERQLPADLGQGPLANELLDLDGGAVPPVDLSDIIAQTDVELQRLGWGVNQGREFLEKTYGKRSRHDLTDEELLQFLLYLETQPAPGA
ncbi:MAG TPA: hypothetical protein VLS96_01105 [Nodosilinea sp.]|nr:hypothetical protein [Nodosilinea sp.]